MTGAGLWERLWQTLADLGSRHSLQALRRVIFLPARRAYRMQGLGIILLAQRLGLPGHSWLLPDPDLSQTLIRLQLRHGKNFGRLADRIGKALRNLMGMAGGRLRLSRYLRLVQP